MPNQLIDSFGRQIIKLRISVTDRCNFRCVYCMPEEGMTFLPRAEVLSFEEIVRLADIFVELGIQKIRLTGGEPLVRRDVTHLVSLLSQIPGLSDLSMTTNGIRLTELAQPLREAGLDRLNVSLDTLDPAKFIQLTRRDMLRKVLDGLDAALDAGFSPIRLNAVAMRGYTDNELIAFAEFARRKPFHIRFIEFMPLDADEQWKNDVYLPGKEIIDQISAVYPLERVPSKSTAEPATRYRFKDGIGEIGIIPTVSEPFCDSCNRVRIIADGHLRTCLFATEETDLKTPLRSGASDEQLRKTILQAVWSKERGHMINQVGFVRPNRSMSQIGG